VGASTLPIAVRDPKSVRCADNIFTCDRLENVTGEQGSGNGPMGELLIGEGSAL